MPCLLRIKVAGAADHVTSCGDRREVTFVDDADRRALPAVLSQARCRIGRFDALARAYCPMGNRCHFVGYTRAAKRSRPMRQINAVFTRRCNTRHRKVGHLFRGRCKAIPVESVPDVALFARIRIENARDRRRMSPVACR